MFICICNAITEHQVQTAVAGGASSLIELQGELGVASCCGSCAETVNEYLPGGRYAVHGALHGTSVRGVMLADAANDVEVEVFQEVVMARC